MVFLCKLLDRLNWPCQRVSVPQWPLITTFPPTFPNLFNVSSGAAAGRWRSVLSRAFKAAAVADAGADPIRIEAVIWHPLM